MIIFDTYNKQIYPFAGFDYEHRTKKGHKMISYKVIVASCLLSVCLTTMPIDLTIKRSPSVMQVAGNLIDNVLQEPAVQISIIWSALNVLKHAYESTPLTSTLQRNALEGAAVGSIVSLLWGFKRASQEACTQTMVNSATSTERLRRTALWSVLLYALTTKWGQDNSTEQLYTAAGLTGLFSLADLMVGNVLCKTKDAVNAINKK